MAEGARWPTTTRHLPKCFAAWPISSTTPARPQYEAVTKAAEALAARATSQQLVAGPLWEADGAGLLAAAYAFHAGLPPQAATVTHIPALVEPSPAPTDGGEQAPPGDPIAGTAGDAAGRTAPGPLSRQARALHQWTQGVCLDLPFTTWTQPMRPGSGRPSPSFGVARSSHAASSFG